MYDPVKFELSKFTLNGKDYHTNYTFEKCKGYNTFNFTPRNPGLYEWVVNRFFISPDGTIRFFPFKGKVEIKDDK